MYSTVLFDLDGTLLDTLADIADAANAVLQARGYPAHSVYDYKLLVGDGVVMLMTRALPEEARTQDEIAACAAEFHHTYEQTWNRSARIYEGIAPLLDELVRRELKLAVLSNKPDEFTRRCVEAFLDHWPWKEVVGQRADLRRKPDPAGALHICERLETAPAQVLYLGDSSVDMRTAVAAGMYPVGCTWGFRSEEELRVTGALAIVHHPSEVLAIIDERNDISPAQV